jgi:hypothetical protein
MILGLSIATFTFLHVLVSLIAIGSGFIVVLGLISGRRLPRWTALFLITTAATSLSGFLFPIKGITPGIVLGILSLVVLLLAVVGLYGARLAGAWRGTYVVTSTLALYFNFFVLIVQAFRKVPALKALAPTQSEAPFKITQLVVLLAFIVLSTLALKRFREEPRGMHESWQRNSSSSD